MKCLQYSGCQIGHIWWWGEKRSHLDLHGVVRLAQGEPQDLQPGDRGLDWVKRFRNACVCMRVVFRIKAVCLKVKAQSKCWFIFKLISRKLKMNIGLLKIATWSSMSEVIHSVKQQEWIRWPLLKDEASTRLSAFLSENLRKMSRSRHWNPNPNPSS